jgi:hypothetical protein
MIPVPDLKEPARYYANISEGLDRQFDSDKSWPVLNTLVATLLAGMILSVMKFMRRKWLKSFEAKFTSDPVCALCVVFYGHDTSIVERDVEESLWHAADRYVYALWKHCLFCRDGLEGKEIYVRLGAFPSFCWRHPVSPHQGTT